MSNDLLIHPAAEGDEGEYTAGRHGHIKSFVRRAGRMSEAQQRYYETMLPKIGIFSNKASTRFCSLGERCSHW